MDVTSKLKAHTIVHENPEKVQCKICGHQLSSLKHLQSHLKTHEKNPERKFNCTRCKLKTDQKANFDRHLKHHKKLDDKLKNNPKAIKCQKCLSVLKNYVEHLRRIHGNLKKLYCDLCKFSAISKNGVVKHIERAHLKKKIK